MRREIIIWSTVGAVVIAAFIATIVILNATLYSAGGFVRGYLEALERQDATGALELAGQSVTGDASSELLVREGMGELSGIQLVSDEADPDGLHHVVYSWQSGSVTGKSTFEVRRTGTLLGLFPTWSFETSPLAVMQLTVQHDDRFSANGVELVTPTPNTPSPYLAFAPGTYELTHNSTYLEAQPTIVSVASPGSVVPGILDIQANAAFVKAAQTAVDKALDDCTKQTVLLPTGCPFGQPIANRIVGEPQWSMLEYPEVALEPGPLASQWRVPSSTGVAHLTVDVKSLFDGSVSTLDEDVDFNASYLVTLLEGDKLAVAAVP